MTRRALLTATAAMLALAACAPTPGGAGNPGGKVATSKGTDANGRTITVAEVKGYVVGPVGYKAGKPAPLPGATAFQLLQAQDDGMFKEEPIAGVQVYLASKAGERFKGPTVATTDIKGEFVIKNVPLDLSFLVMTNTSDPEQRHKELCGITQNVKTAGTVKISYGSTLVVLNTLQTMAGNALGQLSSAIYLQLTASVDAKLKTIKLSELPDISKPEEIQKFMATVSVNGKPATELVNDLRSTLVKNGVDATRVQEALNQLDISFVGAGSASVNGQTVAAGGTNGTITIPPDLASAIFGGQGQATPAPEPTAVPPEPTPEPTPVATATPKPTAAPTAAPTPAATATPSAAPAATPSPSPTPSATAAP